VSAYEFSDERLGLVGLSRTCSFASSDMRRLRTLTEVSSDVTCEAKRPWTLGAYSSSEDVDQHRGMSFIGSIPHIDRQTHVHDAWKRIPYATGMLTSIGIRSALESDSASEDSPLASTISVILCITSAKELTIPVILSCIVSINRPLV